MNRSAAPARDSTAPSVPRGDGPLLQVDNLTKLFALPRRWMRAQRFAKAVDDVSLYLHRGETLGLVGESGCGKSTLARCVLRLLTPDFGQIAFDEENITEMSERALLPVRRKLQAVFQDHYAALDPGLTVAESLQEALRLAPQSDGVPTWLAKVGLDDRVAARRPDELSAGERQRVALARALCVSPLLLVCDEPLSALDVSVRAQMVNLLLDAQAEFGHSYLFISHDLGIVRYVSHRIAVMYLGRIVEAGSARDVVERAAHPYTRALLAAAPHLDVNRRHLRLLLDGSPPDLGRPPEGCAFHPRCPRAEPGRCDVERPELHVVGGDATHAAHEVACHFPHDAASSLRPAVARSTRKVTDRDSRVDRRSK